MLDRTYDEALRAAAPPRVVILGPAPCQRCGAWVEWCGVEWLALLSDEPHDCGPYLEAQLRTAADLSAWQMPTAMARKAATWRAMGGPPLAFDAEGTLLEVPARRLAPRSGAYVQQAHPMASWEEATAMRWLGRGLVWTLGLLAAGLVIAAAARWGGW